jgi:D-aminopeptidase
MTETEHLIHQAAREIGISLDQQIAVEASTSSPGTYTVTFKDSSGADTTTAIAMDASFKRIHDQLKAAWKGKTSA